MEKQFIPQEILDYCISNTSSIPDKSLNLLEEFKNHPLAHMMLGSLVGALIQFLITAKMPKNILEVGTFVGYCTSIIASCSSESSKIISLEEDNEYYNVAKINLTEFIDKGKIELLNIEGGKYLDTCPTNFDFMLIDARKQSYCNKIDTIYGRLSFGGILLVDNALAGLNALNPTKEWHYLTQKFNENLKNDKRFCTVLLPIRDGINLSVKIA